MPGLIAPARGLANNKSGSESLGILGVPKIDLVLDALGAGAVLELRQRQQYGEGFAVGVGGIEHDEREAELVAESGGEIVFTLSRAEEEAGEASVLDRLLGRLHLDEHDLLEMAGQGGLIDRLRRLRQHDRVEALRSVELRVAEAERLEDRFLRLGRRRLEAWILQQHVLQARLLDDPVALALTMIAEVFHPRRISSPGLRSRSGSRFYIYRYEKGGADGPVDAIQDLSCR